MVLGNGKEPGDGGEGSRYAWEFIAVWVNTQKSEHELESAHTS